MSIEQGLKAAGFVTDTLKPLVKTDQGQIWVIESAGGQTAIDLWHRLRSQLHVTMHTPIVLGNTTDLDKWMDVSEINASTTVEAILREAAMNDGKEVLDRLAFDHREELGDDESLTDADAWPDELETATSEASFTSVFDLNGKPLPSVTIALVPTIASWMAPAYLRYGGWNDCPMPEDMVSVLKYWTRLYAIDVFALANDVVEIHVTNPPTTREAAMALATEQYAFCHDIVEQGAETITNLAAQLLNSRSWFFWWD